MNQFVGRCQLLWSSFFRWWIWLPWTKRDHQPYVVGCTRARKYRQIFIFLSWMLIYLALFECMCACIPSLNYCVALLIRQLTVKALGCIDHILDDNWNSRPQLCVLYIDIWVSHTLLSSFWHHDAIIGWDVHHSRLNYSCLGFIKKLC